MVESRKNSTTFSTTHYQKMQVFACKKGEIQGNARYKKNLGSLEFTDFPRFFLLAAGEGFEPSQTESESESSKLIPVGISRKVQFIS